MKKKPAAWGVALSGQLLQDYEALLSKVKVRIRPTDWMDGQAYRNWPQSWLNTTVNWERGIISPNRVLLWICSVSCKKLISITLVSLILRVGKSFLDHSLGLLGLGKRRREPVGAGIRSVVTELSTAYAFDHDLAYLGCGSCASYSKLRFSRASMESFPTFCPLIFTRLMSYVKNTQFRRGPGGWSIHGDRSD